MNATLEKELAGLSAKEKAELIDYLLPDVVADDSALIPSDLLVELEERADAHDKNPTGHSVTQVEAMLFPKR